MQNDSIKASIVWGRIGGAVLCLVGVGLSAFGVELGTEEQKANALERLKKMCPAKYNWYMENKDIKQRTSRVPYQVIYKLLKQDYLK